MELCGGWRVLSIRHNTATVQAGEFGPLDVFYESGHGEWSFKAESVQIPEVLSRRVEPRDSRGRFLITGQVDSEFPTMWPADHNETTDGPKEPYFWSLTVGGIQIDIVREEAPGIEIRTGVWLSVEVSGLTVWSGSD
jgi:hypothetical protein